MFNKVCRITSAVGISRSRIGAMAAAACMLCATLPSLFAAPTIADISPRSLQVGGTVQVRVRGGDLTPDCQLLMPFPVQMSRVVEATGGDLLLEVTLAADVSPGIYPLRMANPRGVSTEALVSVDSLPNVAAGADLGTIPASMTSTLSGGETTTIAFTAAQAGLVTVEIEARRLGSNFQPVIRLLDENKKQLAWSQGSTNLGGDCRFGVTLPQPGKYLLQLHDALYRAGSPGTYRVKVGNFQYGEMVFPLAVQRGQSAQLSMLGGTAAGQSLAFSTSGPETLAVPGWGSITGASGNAPPLVVSDFVEAIEDPAGTTVTAPAGVSGKLSAAGEYDRVTFQVTPGKKYRAELFAERLGSPVDGVVTVLTAAGAVLGAADDQDRTTDPAVDFDVPADITSVLVQVQDLQARGGPEFAYRVVVKESAAPDFRLVVFSASQNIPADGPLVMRVRAQRMGYSGQIQLSLPELPAGVMVSGNEIPAGATDTLLMLQAASGLQVPANLVTIVGQATDGSVSGPRLAVPEAALSRPFVTKGDGQLAMAVNTAPALRVDWPGTSPMTGLPLGYAMDGSVSVTRAAGIAGPVRLSLVSSQIMPQKTIKENNADKVVDDIDRSLRLETAVTLAPEQAAAPVRVLVPGDLPNLPYDLAIKAELLTPDQMNVLETAYSPVFRLSVVAPVTLQLAAALSAPLEVKTGAGPATVLSGTLTRAPGFNDPLTLTLKNLPADVEAPILELPEGATTFEFPITVPHGTSLGELTSASLVAVKSDSSLSPAQISNDLPVPLSIVPGDAAKAELVLLFEDNAHMLRQLNEGDSVITLDRADKFSGTMAAKITANQKYAAKLPGWTFKIKENPAEGEFRYLRFAWKKQGGNNILLQLSGNGNFGAGPGAAGPTLRYEAGVANPFGVPATLVDAKLPVEWTLVTRDLFADFGEFELNGLALSPGAGEYGLFDHVYLARTMDNFAACNAPIVPGTPLELFEDSEQFVKSLVEGDGQATLEPQGAFAGAAAVKVTPGQKFNSGLPNIGLKIRKNPGPGEFRYIRFAWKKQGGTLICLQLNHDGLWGPVESNPAKFRYDAGTGGESFGAAVRVANELPADYVVVTRDLYADFGEFTLTGLSLSPVDGEFAIFDHIYVGQTPRDFEKVRPQ